MIFMGWVYGKVENCKNILREEIFIWQKWQLIILDILFTHNHESMFATTIKHDRVQEHWANIAWEDLLIGLWKDSAPDHNIHIALTHDEITEWLRNRNVYSAIISRFEDIMRQLPSLKGELAHWVTLIATLTPEQVQIFHSSIELIWSSESQINMIIEKLKQKSSVQFLSAERTQEEKFYEIDAWMLLACAPNTLVQDFLTTHHFGKIVSLADHPSIETPKDASPNFFQRMLRLFP